MLGEGDALHFRNSESQYLVRGTSFGLHVRARVTDLGVTWRFETSRRDGEAGGWTRQGLRIERQGPTQFGRWRRK